MNEMYKYLEQHSYISENKKSNYQFELSKERAECIVNKYNYLVEDLNKQIQIMEKYFELITDLGYDYDGFTQEKDLKGLIDQLVHFANLGRVCNITEPIYVNGVKKYNILYEEINES